MEKLKVKKFSLYLAIVFSSCSLLAALTPIVFPFIKIWNYNGILYNIFYCLDKTTVVFPILVLTGFVGYLILLGIMLYIYIFMLKTVSKCENKEEKIELIKTALAAFSIQVIKPMFIFLPCFIFALGFECSCALSITNSISLTPFLSPFKFVFIIFIVEFILSFCSFLFFSNKQIQWKEFLHHLNVIFSLCLFTFLIITLGFLTCEKLLGYQTISKENISILSLLKVDGEILTLNPSIITFVKQSGSVDLFYILHFCFILVSYLFTNLIFRLANLFDCIEWSEKNPSYIYKPSKKEAIPYLVFGVASLLIKPLSSFSTEGALASLQIYTNIFFSICLFVIALTLFLFTIKFRRIPKENKAKTITTEENINEQEQN